MNIRSIGVLFLCLAMIACTTTQSLVVDATQLARTLEPGDRVEIVTREGQELKFVLESVDDQGLSGAGHRIAYAAIDRIGRTQVSAGRTALIVLGIAAVIAAAAGGGGSGGGGGGGY